MEAPIKRAVKNNGHPTEAERPADADVGGKGEGRREGDAGARRKEGRTMRTNANAKEVDRENESGVRLFSTPFATHFRVFRCRRRRRHAARHKLNSDSLLRSLAQLTRSGRAMTRGTLRSMGLGYIFGERDRTLARSNEQSIRSCRGRKRSF